MSLSWCTPENINQVCEHGSQRRKCIHCESAWQDERIAELEQQVEKYSDAAIKLDSALVHQINNNIHLKKQVASLEGELDVANKECEENLRRATELESKISFWFAIGIVAASFAIITLGYYIDTA